MDSVTQRLRAKILLIAKPPQTQAIISNWDLIVQAMNDHLITAPMSFYAMAATVGVETARTFEPICEYGPNSYFLRNYWTNANTRRILGNVVPEDAWKYKGRGFIQITGRCNYGRAGDALHLELLNQPQLAEMPEYAAKIAAWYWETRHIDKLCREISKADNAKPLWMEVRRRVNGGLNGLDEFLEMLKTLGVNSFG